MAQPSDPRFGAGFDADAFRTAINNTIEMASPNGAADKARFVWDAEKTFVDETDNAGNPYDFNVTPYSTTAHEDVQVDVAVTFIDHDPEGSAFGQIDHPRAKLTLLDESYNLVRGADIVFLGNSKYIIDYVEPPMGLFSVDVYTMHVHAVDETS